MTVQFEPQKAQDSAGDGSNADRYTRGQRGHATLRGELQNASGCPTRTSNTGTDRGRRGGLDLLAPVFVHNIWILAHPASPAAVSAPSERGYGRDGGLHHSPSHRAQIWLDRRERASKSMPHLRYRYSLRYISALRSTACTYSRVSAYGIDSTNSAGSR